MCSNTYYNLKSLWHHLLQVLQKLLNVADPSGECRPVWLWQDKGPRSWSLCCGLQGLQHFCKYYFHRYTSIMIDHFTFNDHNLCHEALYRLPCEPPQSWIMIQLINHDLVTTRHVLSQLTVTLTLSLPSVYYKFPKHIIILYTRVWPTIILKKTPQVGLGANFMCHQSDQYIIHQVMI